MGDEEIEFLVRDFQNVNLEENWIPTDDYFMHIDFLQGSSTVGAARINAYMIRNDSFDPRRAVTFPTDLMDDHDRQRERNGPVLQLRRGLAGVGTQYYEFWKVRRNFSMDNFGNMLRNFPTGTRVRVVRVIDNDHEITIFNGNGN
jgi:hypothetical protein